MTTSGARRGRRRAPARLKDRQLAWRTAYAKLRSDMSLACIAVCFASRNEPNKDNLARARHTIVTWARNMASSEIGDVRTLTQCLAIMTSYASLVGTPMVYWTSHKEKRWPAFDHVKINGQKLSMTEWNQLGLLRYRQLYEWYDAYNS